MRIDQGYAWCRYQLPARRAPVSLCLVRSGDKCLGMTETYRENGREYLMIYLASISSGITNTMKRRIFSRQDSRITQMRQDTTEMRSTLQGRNFSNSPASRKNYSPGTTGGKPWDTTNPVVAWLESPDGEYWSRGRHTPPRGALMSTKDDLEIDDDPAYLWYR